MMVHNADIFICFAILSHMDVFLFVKNLNTILTQLFSSLTQSHFKELNSSNHLNLSLRLSGGNGVCV